MKRIHIFLIIIGCLFFSCTNKSKLYFDDNSEYFDIVYDKDSIVIMENYFKHLNKYVLYLKDGEYFDSEDKLVFFSTKKEYKIIVTPMYESFDNLYSNTQLWFQIYKSKRNQLPPDLQKLHQDIFVSELYTTSHQIKDVIRTYYYDRNYKILKISNHKCVAYNVEK